MEDEFNEEHIIALAQAERNRPRKPDPGTLRRAHLLSFVTRVVDALRGALQPQGETEEVRTQNLDWNLRHAQKELTARKPEEIARNIWELSLDLCFDYPDTPERIQDAVKDAVRFIEAGDPGKAIERISAWKEFRAAESAYQRHFEIVSRGIKGPNVSGFLDDAESRRLAVEFLVFGLRHAAHCIKALKPWERERSGRSSPGDALEILQPESLRFLRTLSGLLAGIATRHKIQLPDLPRISADLRKFIRSWSDPIVIDKLSLFLQKLGKKPKAKNRKTWLAEAMFLVREHPDWQDQVIAANVGVDKTTLSHSAEYRRAAKLARGDSGIRRGVRNAKTGHLDAVSSDRLDDAE